MEPIEPINRAINYIEGNLTEAISLEEVSAAAGYSLFHFSRLFLDLIGETPGDYIRKRRLSEAARELVNSRKRILDIALDYQFQSQEAFSRSFKRLFRASPGTYRKRRRLTKTFARITLNPALKKSIYFPGASQQKRVILPRPHLDQVICLHPSAVFTYRASANLLTGKFDAVYLFFDPA
jgi:AraC-like DNA-binding protein